MSALKQQILGRTLKQQRKRQNSHERLVPLCSVLCTLSRGFVKPTVLSTDTNNKDVCLFPCSSRDCEKHKPHSLTSFHKPLLVPKN